MADPIGDALRADCVAYWTMDEESGTRLDSTIYGRNLAIGGGSVGVVSGKKGNAIEYQSDSSNPDTPYLINENAISLQDFCVAQWVNIHSLPPLSSDGEATLIDVGPISYFFIDAKINGTTGEASVTFQDTDTVASPLSASVTADEWHFVIAWRDGNKNYLQVDDGENINQEVATTAWVDIIVVGIAISNQITFDQDEMMLLDRAPTSDERTYLYNSGAGRALFPAPADEGVPLGGASSFVFFMSPEQEQFLINTKGQTWQKKKQDKRSLTDREQ